jgi:hypothetical protein
MAKSLIELAVRLGSKLGANTSKFMGTRTNVNFLGTGPKDGMLFQKSIDPESFATIGIEKVIPDIESSLAYATGGKLNDIELSTLIKNLKTMDETINPTNVVEMGGAGIDSLRAKSGLVERQGTEAASDIKSIDDATAGLNKAEAEADAFSKSIGFPQATETSPLMSKIENRISDAKDAEGLASLRARTGDNNVPLRSMSEILANPRRMADEAAFPGETFNAAKESASGIMATVDKGDLPGKTAASREFLVNALKKENINQTTFGDIVDPADMKFIMEGGGGVEADPIVLVQKYFGPRVAEMVPVGGTAEEIAIFTDRVLKNMVDAKGLKPTEFGFDNMTAKFVDQLADGGIAGLETRQGLKFGGKIAKNILSKIDDTMIKKAADDIFPTDDYKYDAEMVVEALVENNPKLFKNLLADDLDDALRSELYGLAVGETGNRAAMKMMTRRDAVKRGVVNEVPEPFKRESMKLADGVTGKGEKFKTFETTTPPRMFQLNVEKAVSELNIPRAEAIRIAQLPSDQQKLALQKYMDTDMAQRTELMNYSPKTFDAAKGGRAGYSKGGLAKILEL